MPGGGSPRVFRILVPAQDLRRSKRFYEALLGVPGREVSEGRVYLDCGDVILGLLDYSGREGDAGPPSNEAIYFATPELEAVHRRAQRLDCLSRDLLHGDPESPMGEVRIRPWGERSFYAIDPSGNALCFVDETTIFTGTRAQVTALEKSTSRDGRA
jgi:catechol 2,3-dioxygenase-like lactoylglutathione lyase family enzyme